MLESFAINSFYHEINFEQISIPPLLTLYSTLKMLSSGRNTVAVAEADSGTYQILMMELLR